MQRIKIYISLLLFLLIIVINDNTGYASNNLTICQRFYNVTSDRTIIADSPSAIESSLKTAGNLAASGSPYIVYVPSGTYKMDKKLTVPQNVILVAESGSVFIANSDTNFTQFFMVYGVLYGGKYDGNKKAYYCLRLGDSSFSGINGYIKEAEVHSSKKAGIIAVGNNSSNGNIINCVAYNCGNSGISVVEGAYVNTISGCESYSNISSGINLGHSNVAVIKDCMCHDNTGHGISTDSDGVGQGYCHINKIMGCVIYGNSSNGVYIDEYCHVNEVFSRNEIYNNYSNGLSIDANAYVQIIAKNDIYANHGANLKVSGKNANAYIGNSNNISNSMTNNITISDRGRVTIQGKNNIISSADSIGISVLSKSRFRDYGSNTVIKDNSGFGIRVSGNSYCELKNTIFSGNCGWAVKVYKGGSITYTNTNLGLSKTSENRLYMD